MNAGCSRDGSHRESQLLRGAGGPGSGGSSPPPDSPEPCDCERCNPPQGEPEYIVELRREKLMTGNWEESD